MGSVQLVRASDHESRGQSQNCPGPWTDRDWVSAAYSTAGKVWGLGQRRDKVGSWKPLTLAAALRLFGVTLLEVDSIPLKRSESFLDHLSEPAEDSTIGQCYLGGRGRVCP